MITRRIFFLSVVILLSREIVAEDCFPRTEDPLMSPLTLLRAEITPDQKSLRLCVLEICASVDLTRGKYIYSPVAEASEPAEAPLFPSASSEDDGISICMVKEKCRKLSWSGYHPGASAAVSRDGTLIAVAASDDRGVEVRRASDGKLVRLITKKESFASAWPQFLENTLYVNFQSGCPGCEDWTLVDPISGRVISKMGSGRNWIDLGGHVFAFVDAEANVIFVNLAKGQELVRIAASVGEPTPARILKSGSELVIATAAGHVLVVDIASRKLLRHFKGNRCK